MIGIYGGTFDPFTTGHEDIARRALALVDELHIVIGRNVHKPEDHTDREDRVGLIKKIFSDVPKVIVRSYDGILAKYALSLGNSGVLVRGLRSAKDLEAETAQALVNRLKYGVETVFLLSDPSLSFVSSSLVRELEAFGEDASEYLPKV